jgi:hypothetical protein
VVTQKNLARPAGQILLDISASLRIRRFLSFGYGEAISEMKVLDFTLEEHHTILFWPA